MAETFLVKSIIFILSTFIVVQCEISAPNSWENEVVENLKSANEDSIDLSMFGERIYGHPDEGTGNLVATYDSTLGNPEELGSYLEGDILIPNDHSTVRNGIVAKSYRWPDAIVPYEIKGSFSARDLSIIEYAMNEYHKKTCVRFRPRKTERDYISIENANTGCWASVGRLGGRQQVNLQTPSCLMTYGTPIHELMHSLGFFHEQNRSERDGYVRVLSENVKQGMMPNFQKSSSKTVYGFGIPYDYASVMHYSSKSFSRNGKPTLMALVNSSESRLMGQRGGFSSGDIAKINAMYNCKRRRN